MKNQPFIIFLKLFREDAVFDSAGRLFHILAPRKEKHFCPLADLFFGNLKSVSVFRRLREEHAEFFVKRLHRYCGAKSLSNLKTIVLDSLLMSSSMACQPNFAISGLLEAFNTHYRILSNPQSQKIPSESIPQSQKFSSKRIPQSQNFQAKNYPKLAHIPVLPKVKYPPRE